MRELIRALYSLARFLNNLNSILSFNPGRIMRRQINRQIGKATGRLYLRGRRK